jgi:hypothetical protein
MRTLLFAFVLALPFAYAAEEEVQIDETDQERMEGPRSTKQAVQDALEEDEDVEMQTEDGEVEYDKDVIGDDEVEIND